MRHSKGTQEEINGKVNTMGKLISFVTILVNIILQTTSRISTLNEKWSTVTKHNVKLAEKITNIQFANTAIL
jgi:hypothetical protein